MTTGTAGNDFIDDALVFSTTTNTIDALGGDDSIIGANSDDVIYGGAGADTITSNGANPGFNVPGFPVIAVGGDLVYGGDGDDVITTDIPGVAAVSSIGDTVFGGAGNDMIVGAVFGAASPTDSLFGGMGNDTIDGNTGNDVIDAGLGNDLVIARRGEDTVDGGDGTDRIDFSQDADSIIFNMATGVTTTRLGALTEIESNVNFEEVIATSGNDVVVGTSGADLIETLDGDDTIFGGAGADVLRAGGGDDSIVGGEGGDDRDELDYADQEAGLTVVLTGDEAGTVSGTSAGEDRFSQIERFILTEDDDAVNAWSDTSGLEIDLRGGDDFVRSGQGADSIEGGEGVDEIAFFDSNDAVTIDAAAGTGSGGDAEGDRFSGFEIYQLSDHGDVFFGGADGETIEGNDGNDTLLGNEGADTIIGGVGSDTIEGGEGADSLMGDLGVDTLSYAGSGAGVVVSLATGSASGGDAEGDDFTTNSGQITFEDLMGSDHDDVLEGSVGINVLSGLDGDDTIIAGGSSDVVFGGAGNDLLVGGGGSDSMDGGAGVDTVDYSESSAGLTVFVDVFVNGGDATGDVLANIENFILSDQDDVLFGGATANSVSGGAGDDYLSTGADDDQLFGGLGGDVLEPGAGADIVDGGEGTDLLSLFDATSGVTVNLNNMALSSADYADDVLISIEGILGNATNSNTLIGTNAEDLFIGGNASDVISGNGGADVLLGQGDNDAINGGGGADVLISGLGDDTLTGDGGGDTFLFALNGPDGDGDGVDVITDFTIGSAGASDFILFYGSEFTAGATVTISEASPGGNALLEYGTSSSVEIVGTTQAEVEALPFLYFFAG